MYIKSTGKRIFAMFIDSIAFMFFGYILHLLFGIGEVTNGSNGFSFTIEGVEALITGFAYFLVLAIIIKVDSLGKKLLQLETRKLDMSTLTYKETIMRGFVKGLLFITTPISLITILFTTNKQAVHDLIMKTTVVTKVKEKDIVYE